MAFGKHIEKLRLKRGMTEREMAEILGVPAPRYSKWEENDATPRAEDRAKIEAAFGSTWEEILTLKELPKLTPQKSYQNTRLNLKNNGSESDDIPVLVGNTRAGTITIYSDDPSQQEPVGHLSSKVFPGCNHAEKINGDSMYPLAVNQGLAIGKIIDKRGFVWGEKYIIHTIHGQAMMKYVHPSAESRENIMIVSHNKKIPPQDIPLNDITFCCRVYFIVNPS